ncbi:MAG: Adenylate cyclase [Chloroflexi bacterium AL-W]|nr:Adenylate cyclase [Chloroflexi bacterium AL-N1]NOK65418.1 Adenylate cyclase [Chloroflexi bacterium AL-N10]NOK72316.1 Adenylate cyclase [Chloroflexi bacterium AL-N5]NOK79597.1 Adenylate cyclase [Chloroflexi bacterium AL-W]NOK87513.1 Adenylate cyclase [Chloroflexi bacterium AL-N15]
MRAQILVVDDEIAIVELLSRFLTREGHQVITATNGVEALEKVRQHPPDLILLDVVMPGMDGFTLCQQLKENEETALIPITMLTGQDDYGYRTRGIESGADDFLSKPFEPSILRARIRSQLRIKRLTDQLDRTENVIFMMALAIEEKDPYTEGHIRRMSVYSEQLAIACGLNDAMVRAIRYGGFLHDIGKIGVSEAILCKPGPLNPEEIIQMRQHPEIGARIISPMRFARDVAPIVYGHHERWDGAGYPNQLSGENIPIGARIVSIVDAYDAMTTDRPYRAALSELEAVNRLWEGSGTQFDPQILSIFLAIIERGELSTTILERAPGILDDLFDTM